MAAWPTDGVRRRGGGRSPRCNGSSPRSAGSAPTRASSRASGSPPGSPVWTGSPAHEPLVRSLARLDPAGDGFAATATLSVGAVAVELDTRGSIDVAAERARLDKDRAAAEKEAAQCRAKLDNPAFIGKAPEQVVGKIRDRLAAAEAELDRIDRQLDALPAA